MNNVINNKTVGVEYSEYFRSARKEVSEENAKTASHESTVSPKSERIRDKIELNANLQISQDTAEMFSKDYADGIVSMLLGKITQSPVSAFEAQGNLQASRMAALLES